MISEKVLALHPGTTHNSQDHPLANRLFILANQPFICNQLLAPIDFSYCTTTENGTRRTLFRSRFWRVLFVALVLWLDLELVFRCCFESVSGSFRHANSVHLQIVLMSGTQMTKPSIFIKKTFSIIFRPEFPHDDLRKSKFVCLFFQIYEMNKFWPTSESLRVCTIGFH